MMILTKSTKKQCMVNLATLLVNQPLCIFQFLCDVLGFTRYLNTGFDLDILSSQLEYCKWSVAILAMSSHISIYLIVAMTFERVYSIIRPHKAASFNTMKRATITIFCYCCDSYYLWSAPFVCNFCWW